MILYSKTFREGLEDPLHGIYMYIPINKDILPILHVQHALICIRVSADTFDILTTVKCCP